MTLHRAVIEHASAREYLLNRFPSLADDPECLADMVEGECRLDLKEAILWGLRKMDSDLAKAEALKIYRAQLSEREDRLRHRAERMKADLLEALQDTGRDKIELPDATLSVRQNPPKVIVTDEAVIPAEFRREPEPPSADKKKIAEALKGGREVPGALLSNGGVNLTVKRS